MFKYYVYTLLGSRSRTREAQREQQKLKNCIETVNIERFYLQPGAQIQFFFGGCAFEGPDFHKRA